MILIESIRCPSTFSKSPTSFGIEADIERSTSWCTDSDSLKAIDEPSSSRRSVNWADAAEAAAAASAAAEVAPPSVAGALTVVAKATSAVFLAGLDWPPKARTAAAVAAASAAAVSAAAAAVTAAAGR